jgi:hypothetical protein
VHTKLNAFIAEEKSVSKLHALLLAMKWLEKSLVDNRLVARLV